MDALERGGSQSRGASIKRPWDENAITLPSFGQSKHARHVGLPPPIHAVPLVPHGRNRGPASTSWYGAESGEPAEKKAKIEEREYYSYGRQSTDARDKLSPRPHNLRYSQNRSPPEWPTSSPGTAVDIPPSSQGSSYTGERPRWPTTQDREREFSEFCERCSKNPELDWTTQAAAAGLAQLSETLLSCIPSDQRCITGGCEQAGPTAMDCPLIAQSGLKHTLSWLFGRIKHVNKLADDLVRQRNAQKHIAAPNTNARDIPTDTMKRRLNDDIEGTAQIRGGVVESRSESDSLLRRKRDSIAMASPPGEKSPPARSQRDYRPFAQPADGHAPRLSSMNPPPTRLRQLPSPPGRSLSSPNSLHQHSPSAPSYGANPQSASLPPPLSLINTMDTYLPPMSTSPGSDSALREHAASLQHEVSLQKIALSSLQGEHDKLLSAFTRSQTRATALEKKHAVSDNEIITLTEDKLRLQAQITDLERDVEELSASRDECRQVAVQEGAQYVEIVNRAGKLEEMTIEERKSWNRTKQHLEAKIDYLKTKYNHEWDEDEVVPAIASPPLVAPIDTTVASIGFTTDPKIEPVDDTRAIGSMPHPPDASHESIEDLKGEIRRYRERCAEIEQALRGVRESARAMEGYFKDMQNQADAGLKD